MNLTRVLPNAVLAGALSGILVCASSAHAQTATAGAGYDGRARCEVDDYRRSWYQTGAPACHVRRIVLERPRGALVVDASEHSGYVSVRGATPLASEDAPARDVRKAAPLNSAVQVEAVVVTWAGTTVEAERLAALVHVDTSGGRLRAAGFPEQVDGQDRRYWSVSYRVVTPRQTDLDLRTYNGGIEVTGVTGRLRLDAHNGGVSLVGVGGDVVAHSNNGGVRATLTGRAWETGGLPGAGLDLSANNGGAELRIPDGYRAQVSAGANNGPLAIDVPVTTQGKLDGRRVTFALGGGGAPVRVYSNNGGARVARAAGEDGWGEVRDGKLRGDDRRRSGDSGAAR